MWWLLVIPVAVVVVVSVPCLLGAIWQPRWTCWLLGHEKPTDCPNGERCYFCWYQCPRCGGEKRRPPCVECAKDDLTSRP